MNKQANASAKLKEFQPIAQADTVAAHLLLPNRTPRPLMPLQIKIKNVCLQTLI